MTGPWGGGAHDLAMKTPARDPRPAASRTVAQRHTLQLDPRALTVRSEGEGDGAGVLRFAGHAVVYDRWTEIYDWWFGSYLERIAPGAAHGVLDHDVRLLMNHDPNLVLARTTSGSLRLYEDSTGVLVEAELAPTTYARDLATLLQRGDVSQMSFSFVPGDEEWDERPDGMWLRTITRLDELYDVSIVTYPAYEDTDAGMRSWPRVARAGRRNSAADEAVIRSTAETLRTAADDLDGLLEERDSESEDNGERGRKGSPATANGAALIEQQRRHHEAAARRYRMGGRK